MLRINLLPPYIHDKNKKTKIGVAWVVAIVAVIAFLLFVNTSAHTAQAAATARRDLARDKKATTDGLKKQISDEQAARAVTQSKQTFIADSRKYNDSWPETFDIIRDVTPSDHNIILKSMEIDPASRKTITLDGWGASEATVVRWWMSLRNNTDLFDHINFQIPPHDWPPKSADSNGGGPGGPSSMGGGGGRQGGGGGGKMMAPMMLGPMSGGGGGMGGGGGNTKDPIGPAELRGRMGLNFVASISLKKALADGINTPTWPAGAAATGGGGGGMPTAPMGGPGPMTGGPGPRSNKGS